MVHFLRLNSITPRVSTRAGANMSRLREELSTTARTRAYAIVPCWFQAPNCYQMEYSGSSTSWHSSICSLVYPLLLIFSWVVLRKLHLKRELSKSKGMERSLNLKKLMSGTQQLQIWHSWLLDLVLQKSCLRLWKPVQILENAQESSEPQQLLDLLLLTCSLSAGSAFLLSTKKMIIRRIETYPYLRVSRKSMTWVCSVQLQYFPYGHISGY